MPRAHFECPTCHQLYDLSYTVADVDGPDWPPSCLECDVYMELAPQPGDYKWDLRTDAESDSRVSGQQQKFTIHRQVPTKDGLKQVEEVVDSTHRMRQIEKESEQRFRDGEGEPIRFRALSQDRSNLLTGSFGTEGTLGGRAYDSGQTPQKKQNITVRRHGSDQPAIPISRSGGVSPLP